MIFSIVLSMEMISEQKKLLDVFGHVLTNQSCLTVLLLLNYIKKVRRRVARFLIACSIKYRVTTHATSPIVDGDSLSTTFICPTPVFQLDKL